MRRCFDVPLAPSIGISAKRATEPGAPSLKHPVARVFSAIVATSPLASLKWCNKDQSNRENTKLCAINAAQVPCVQASTVPPFTQILAHSRRKIRFRKECGFDSHRPHHHFSAWSDSLAERLAGPCLSGLKRPKGRTSLARNDDNAVRHVGHSASLTGCGHRLRY